MRNVSEVVEKVKAHISRSIIFPPPKSCRLSENVEKYGTAGQATDEIIIWSMLFACWITKATDTHSKYTGWVGSKQALRNGHNVYISNAKKAKIIFTCSVLNGNMDV